MRALITGANGQLGRALTQALAADAATPLTRDDCDITHEPSVMAAVLDHAPEVVVHTAALTDVEACEADPHRAWQVNALGAWWVARACAIAGARMIHVSCQDVFDGRLGRPLTEFDAPAPASVHGRAKEAGEQLVRTALADHCIVRTAWLQGAADEGPVGAVLRQARQQGVVEADDATSANLTLAADLAPALRHVAAAGRPGTYHLTAAGHCTGYELAQAVLAHAGLDVPVRPLARSETAPPRPAFAVLDNHLPRLLGWEPLPDWLDGGRRLLAE